MVRLIPPSPVCDDAEFTTDGTERLWLSRKVAEEGPVGLIIGLNPSTAGSDVASNDQTIKKLTVFTRQWGWSGFWMTNLFTRIETKSAKLRSVTYQEALGTHGAQVLEAAIPLAPVIVTCWSAAVPKDKRHRVLVVQSLLRGVGVPIWCFGESQDGSPIHPLMLSYDTQLVPYRLPDLPVRASRRDED